LTALVRKEAERTSIASIIHPFKKLPVVFLTTPKMKGSRREPRDAKVFWYPVTLPDLSIPKMSGRMAKIGARSV